MLLVSALALLPACFDPEPDGVPGDRLTTGCPLRDVCDPDTDGLRFTGAERPTAVDGVQTVRLWLADGEYPEGLELTAESSDRAVFDLEDGVGSVLVRGRGVGSATLSIRDAEGRLVDQVTLFVAEVAQVELRSRHENTAYLFANAWQEPEPLEWSFLAGGRALAVARPLTASGDPVVDESLEIEGGELVDVPDGDGETEIVSVRAGGQTHAASAPVVREVARLAREEYEATTAVRAPALSTGGTSKVCFRPLDAQGRTVAGVALDVETSGPIEATTFGADNVDRSCVELAATEAGLAELTVRAPGVERVIPVRVRP